eukprot:363443-Chlamydomonas_euryale.AAC.4
MKANCKAPAASAGWNLRVRLKCVAWPDPVLRGLRACRGCRGEPCRASGPRSPALRHGGNALRPGRFLQPGHFCAHVFIPCQKSVAATAHAAAARCRTKTAAGRTPA